MWLLPLFRPVAQAASRAFYRLEVSGGEVPRSGPVLLVANHRNFLFDPLLVVVAGDRPARFLAKAPLFDDPLTGWVLRAVGAIPVYRAQDDPSRTGMNEDMFRAAHAALAEGAAVGIFPEGISHSEPAMAPLKTGAARIALGAAARLGGSFPVVPVGLSYRAKTRFRSPAVVLVGTPVEWADLATAPDAAEATRELTRRLEAALREVTVNLESWEDAPLLECAAEVYAAEFGLDAAPAGRIGRLRLATETLARLRRSEGGEWEALAREVTEHAAELRRLGLSPRDLGAEPSWGAAAGWVLRRAALFALGGPLAILGIAVFYLPYRATGALADRSGATPDARSTYKLLGGLALHLLWVLALAGAAWRRLGPPAAAATLLLAPPLGWATLRLLERWRESRAEARRFVARTGRRGRVAELRERQRGLAARLEELNRRAPV